MFRRLTAVLCLVVAMTATSVPNANAALSTGVCVIGLTFTFDSPISAASAPDFSFSGGGTCAATLGGSPTGSVSIWGDGGSVIWNCAGVVATGGNWNQVFSQQIPNVNGSFTIAPVNGAYVFTVTGPGFVGTAQMTLLTDAASIATCPLNSVRSLSMAGVMEFQDP